MKMSKELVQLSCQATFQRKYAMKSTVTMLKISKDKFLAYLHLAESTALFMLAFADKQWRNKFSQLS